MQTLYGHYIISSSLVRLGLRTLPHSRPQVSLKNSNISLLRSHQNTGRILLILLPLLRIRLNVFADQIPFLFITYNVLPDTSKGDATSPLLRNEGPLICLGLLTLPSARPQVSIAYRNYCSIKEKTPRIIPGAMHFKSALHLKVLHLICTCLGLLIIFKV